MPRDDPAVGLGNDEDDLGEDALPAGRSTDGGFADGADGFAGGTGGGDD